MIRHQLPTTSVPNLDCMVRLRVHMAHSTPRLQSPDNMRHWESGDFQRWLRSVEAARRSHAGIR